MLVFACAATGMLNCQIMEGGKNAACVLNAFNRFFSEAVVPKVCYIDKDSAIIKVLKEANSKLWLMMALFLNNEAFISKLAQHRVTQSTEELKPGLK